MIYSIFFRNNILYKLKRYSKLNAFKEINFTNKSIFIDLGGNNGVVSQYIWDKYKCFIYIYEPHRKCFQILKKKFYNNKKIKIYNLAVSNSSGYKKFYFHSNVKPNDFYNLALSESSSLEKRKKIYQKINLS
jgi:FkbM family methyltransferase